VLDAKDKSFDRAASERVSTLVFAAGVLMLIASLVIQYFRLVH
jgi:hypothetical protein